MCNHPHCIYIDILTMTNGEKLYIHYDNNLIPIMFQYCDENRKFEAEYERVNYPNLYREITIPELDTPQPLEILPDAVSIDMSFIEDLS